MVIKVPGLTEGRMTNPHGRTRENEFAELILQILKENPSGQASFSEIINEIPRHIYLTEEDKKPSGTRFGEQMWEQRVRNITSHKDSRKNYIYEGYMESVPDGLRITERGKNKPQGDLF
jgi:glycine cleavage system pyridoxal-binding protein P